MKLFLKILIPLLVIATATACSDLFKSSDDGPRLTFSSSVTDGETTIFNGDTLIFRPAYRIQEKYSPPPFKSGMENNKITINGYFLTSGGFQPEGELNKIGNKIRITVHPPEEPVPQTSMSAGWLYDAYITNLEKGNYKVIIVHKFDYIYSLKSDFTTTVDTVFTETFEIE